MSNQDLEKLFEAALHEKQAPSRFGTPEELRKSVPAAFSRPAPGSEAQGDASAIRAAPSAFQAAPPVGQAAPSVFRAAAPTPSAFQAAQSVPIRDSNAEASLDVSINAELAAIMDAKVLREKRRRRRGFVFTLLFFLGVTGGATGWVVINPERYQALKAVIAEIKSVGDIQGMVAKYQQSLDKIAVRGTQIDAATTAMGIDPSTVDEHEDPGFDKEMQEMMGKEGGKTTAARDKLLREKFKDVQESGSLVPKKDSEKTKDKQSETKDKAKVAE
ncbi:hypothetical protein HZ994_17525 [Akkermansiaceae bacterium]|nr:hypothetical protein HZ994_17525 [Akkermansiaceae bacterium]